MGLSASDVQTTVDRLPISAQHQQQPDDDRNFGAALAMRGRASQTCLLNKAKEKWRQASLSARL
jgi:hypothetical protein